MNFHLLHIADPHFTYCEHTDPDPRQVVAYYAKELEEQIQIYQKKQGWRGKFDAAIFSGDFTAMCREGGFQTAAGFIEAIAGWVKPNGIMVIPGNHDVDLGEASPLRGLSLPVAKSDAERKFRELFLARIEPFVGRPNARLSMVRRVGRPNEREVVLICLNSNRVERRDAQGWGYVGADQIFEIGTRLLHPVDGAGIREGDVVIAVTHHNPLPIWDLGLQVMMTCPDRRKFSFMIDTAATLDALTNLGAGILLHGHTHVRSAKRVEGYGDDETPRPMLVLGSGSLGVLGGPEGVVHNFQIIRVTDDSPAKTPALRRGNGLPPVPAEPLFAGPADVYITDVTVVSHNPDGTRNWVVPAEGRARTVFPFSGATARRALKNMEQNAHRADRDEAVSESWAQLRRLEKPDWDARVREIAERVREYVSNATDLAVKTAIDGFFKDPPVNRPSEYDLSQWTLEEYLARVLRR